MVQFEEHPLELSVSMLGTSSSNGWKPVVSYKDTKSFSKRNYWFQPAKLPVSCLSLETGHWKEYIISRTPLFSGRAWSIRF